MTGRARALLLALFFLSGFTALVYEVVWLKELSRLFGTTAYAAATTLAAFFAGLAAGGRFWGQRAGRVKSPLRLYAWLEVGVAATALGYLGLSQLYALVYPALAGAFGFGGAPFTAVKFLLALLVLFPPAFCMGGTFPALGQLLVRSPDRLGQVGTQLYTLNTLGAALGAFAAGFLLPPLLGYTGTCLLAVATNVAIGLGALALARKAPADTAADTTKKPKRSKPAVLSRRAVAALALASGVGTLAFEVLVTHALQLVTRSDVYSFATVLVTFLIALGGGGLLANRLCRRERPERALRGLLLAGGIGVGLSFLLLHLLTSGLTPWWTGASGWLAYVASLFALAGVVVGLPVITIGAVFPFTLRLYGDDRPGRAIGDLVALNTLGAIAGSLIGGFVLLPLLGLAAALLVVAAGYLLAAAVVGRSLGSKGFTALAAALALLALVAIVPARGHAPQALNPEFEETLVELTHGAHGSVAVIHAQAQLVGAQGPSVPLGQAEDLMIRVDNHYTLGGLNGLADERRQAHLPLLIHGAPRSVFFLGLATGITAGAALEHPVERVVVAELVPEVVDAARAHFGPYSGGLFADPRARIVVEDGRNVLFASAEQYDVIVADLFLPWAAGARGVYSREHFETVRSRLADGGLFAQWLPLYQMTEEQVGIVTRTLLEVFPQVTLWRGNFSAREPLLLLVARAEARPLDPVRFLAAAGALEEDVLSELLLEIQGVRRPPLSEDQRSAIRLLLPQFRERVPFTFYVANLSEQRARFADFPLDTDDDPQIAYRATRDLASRGFVGEALRAFLEDLARSVPIERDPYARGWSELQRDCVLAGLSYYAHMVERERGPAGAPEASRLYQDYKRRLALQRPGR